MKQWYNCGIKVVLVYVVILVFIFSVLRTFGYDFAHELSFMLWGASLWQLVLTLTGHYK